MGGSIKKIWGGGWVRGRGVPKPEPPTPNPKPQTPNLKPKPKPQHEPESFIRVWIRGYSGRVVIGSTRLTRLLFRVGYGSRVIGFGSGRVRSTRHPRSKMNVTRQPEPDSFIRVWVRGYSGRVVI